MIRFKKVFLLIICLLIITMVSGCWDRRELNELAIIMAAGVDITDEGKTELTLQLARPPAFTSGATAGGAPVQKTTWVISGVGDTIYDAQDKIGSGVAREQYWSHSMLMVFSQEAASTKLLEVLNFIYRFPEPRETMSIFVTPGKAKDILNSNSAIENTSAQSLFHISRSKKGFGVEFAAFVRDFYAPGTNAAAPRVEELEAGKLLGTDTEKPPEHSELAITGTALFKADKFAGYLNPGETYGMSWLRGKTLRRAGLTAPGLKDKNKKIAFEVIRNHASIDPVYEGGKIKFFTRIVVEGNIAEQQGEENLLNLENIKKFEESIAGVISEQIREALNKAKDEYGTDVFGFGETFHRKYKKEWAKYAKNWDENFSESEIYLDVDVKIRNTGKQTDRPLLQKKDQRS